MMSRIVTLAKKHAVKKTPMVRALLDVALADPHLSARLREAGARAEIERLSKEKAAIEERLAELLGAADDEEAEDEPEPVHYRLDKRGGSIVQLG